MVGAEGVAGSVKVLVARNRSTIMFIGILVIACISAYDIYAGNNLVSYFIPVWYTFSKMFEHWSKEIDGIYCIGDMLKLSSHEVS